jgi:hypothetical protein
LLNCAPVKPRQATRERSNEYFTAINLDDPVEEIRLYHPIDAAFVEPLS